MKKLMKKMKSKDLIFWVSFIISVALIVAGFLIPPTGIIDGSVLTAVGLLLGFSTIHKLPQIFNKADKITAKVGDKFELDIDNKDD